MMGNSNLLYCAAISAQIIKDGVKTTLIAVATFFSNNDLAAEGYALRLARERWPSATGFHSYQAVVLHIDQSIIDQVGR